MERDRQGVRGEQRRSQVKTWAVRDEEGQKVDRKVGRGVCGFVGKQLRWMHIYKKRLRWQEDDMGREVRECSGSVRVRLGLG